MNDELSNAFSELVEILNWVEIEDYNKIPKAKIDFFKKNSNKNNTFKYDPNLNLEEQGVSEYTRAIIVILFRDYWATEKQRNKLLEREKRDLQLIEEEKMAKFKQEDIFKNTKYAQENLKEDSIKNNLPVEIQKKKWYQRIFSKIKKIFN